MRSRSLRSEAGCPGAAGLGDEAPVPSGEGAGGQGAGGPHSKKKFWSWRSWRRRSENLLPLSCQDAKMPKCQVAKMPRCQDAKMP